MNTLGNKIRVFRKLKGLSQLELELAIGASSGMISRIENNEVNPTKETLFKIARILKLNNLELQYLSGLISEAANIEEIEAARDAVKEYYKKPGVFSYIVDDRSRIVDISDSFLKLGNLIHKKQDLLLKFWVELIYNMRLGVREFIAQDDLDSMIYKTFIRTFSEMHFMQGDELYEKLMKYINENAPLKTLWERASKETSLDLQVRSNKNREVIFMLKGKKVKMHYSAEPLWVNHRFTVLHYDTPNLLVKLFKNSGIF